MASVASPADPPANESLAAALEAQKYLQSRLAAPSTSTTSPSFRSIPIIDLSPSFSTSITARQEVAKQISKACTEVGFFYITGHGIPQSACDAVLELVERFFNELSLSALESIHIKNSKQFRGYEPSQYTSLNDFTTKETKEAFNWGYESGLDPTGGDGKYVELDGTAEGGQNQWPKEEELPGFYRGIADYYGQVKILRLTLLRRLTYP